MIAYVLTAVAGVLVGIVALRVWQAREPDGAALSPADAPTQAPAAARTLFNGRNALIAAGLAVVAAVGITLFRGDETETGPASPTAIPGGVQSRLDDVDSMISRLAARLEKEPGDGEGFRMLGWSYVMTGHPEKALEPYKRAIALLPAKAVVHAGYGEALVGVAGGKVTPEAKAVFDKAVALDPGEPRARYFLALWQAQHGGGKQALDTWIDLANGGPADAPWQADVRRQIDETARKLGVDVSSRLKPAGAGVKGEPPAIAPAAMQAAQGLPPADRQAMIDRMVEGLAARLKANPKDADGWARLLRSRMVLKQQDQAARDLATARGALSGEGLAQVNAAAAELGVPGAR